MVLTSPFDIVINKFDFYALLFKARGSPDLFTFHCLVNRQSSRFFLKKFNNLLHGAQLQSVVP